MARLATLALLLFTAFAQAQIAASNKISDVRGTKHNLSAAADGSATPSGGTVPVRAVKATSETQVCVFCHTPHEATSGIVAPLWNRQLSGATYTPYTSSSLEADAAQLAAAPGGSSKLCLSCHDGTMAIDKVNVLNGIKNATIAMTGTSGGKMPISPGAGTGFTRNLGTDLSNDHPISFTYDSTLAGRDGELRSPDGVLVGNRVRGATPPKLPLENNQVQCSTCHDPHLRDKTASNGNAKFLRMNRFQVAQPAGAIFNSASDIICLACHDKAGASWAFSAHANSQVATQRYTPAAAQLREFPSSLDTPANANPPVWQVGCLNCHDTHSVQDSRRLLREGTNTKTGGSAALEEACYQCHAPFGSSAVTYAPLSANAIPDIKTDFGLATHMPIAAATEVHDIGGVFNDGPRADCSKITGKCGIDMLESRTKLGEGNLTNRHAECSDCHNPHRVVKFRDFRGNSSSGNITGTPDAAGTHPHTDNAMNHTNIASGVLRGSWGVEPTYGGGVGASFQSLPTGFRVVRGDPGTSSSAAVTETFVTREYQICLKCHSDYGYSDNNLPQTDGGTGFGNRPTLGTPGTPPNTNGVTMYTNQAKEFQAPIAHAGETVGVAGGGAAAAFEGAGKVNHRSWHPVMNATGRTTTIRGMSGGNPWLAPWNNQVGSNTMYCSDCHGSSVISTTSVVPDNGDNGNPWGPHGSTNDFILKGAWTDTGGGNASLLCFKCHAKANYTSGNDTGRKTGFYDRSSGKGNLHNYHVDRMGKELRCTWCHVAVPHGWKNKGLLVNLNDLGPEVGKTAGTAAPTGAYTNGPYYYKAVLRVTTFASSGAWAAGDCGGKDYMRGAMCGSPP
ncbi:MAG: hypothetical protein HHJ18_15715 [Polaromonas sp.]|nr:hypothetical protein [Polaromonas sp.]